MIDSLLKVTFSSEKMKTQNPYIQWLLSAGRDRQLILWKLLDGKVLRRFLITPPARIPSSNS